MSSLLLTSVLSILLHAGGIAEYHISGDGDEIHMKVIIDQDELAAFNFSGDCDFANMTALCLSQYVAANSTVIMNGESIQFQLEGSSTENHHFILIMSAPSPNNEITSIEVQNNCFTEFDPDFKNRIVLDIGKFQSSYLLSKANSMMVAD